MSDAIERLDVIEPDGSRWVNAEYVDALERAANFNNYNCLDCHGHGGEIVTEGGKVYYYCNCPIKDF